MVFNIPEGMDRLPFTGINLFTQQNAYDKAIFC